MTIIYSVGCSQTINFCVYDFGRGSERKYPVTLKSGMMALIMDKVGQETCFDVDLNKTEKGFLFVGYHNYLKPNKIKFRKRFFCNNPEIPSIL